MGAAFEQFKESIELANALKKMERDKFPANPKLSQQSIVKGLRGGTAVLIVASFEYFLRRLFEENISKLNTTPVSINFKKLPDRLKVKAVYHSLHRAMDGPLYEAKPPKVDRLSDIEIACKMIISEQVNPLAFSDTSNNPNSETVKEKFNEVGIPDIFEKIKNDFETKWGDPVTDNFIKYKLNEIVRTRNVVAHTTDTLNITRSSQNEAFKFLRILSELLEKELDKHIKDLQRIAKK
ncbi:hypothetical protein ES705_41915 [subsurface metagenome]